MPENSKMIVLEQKNIFSDLKENNCQPRIPYTVGYEGKKKKKTFRDNNEEHSQAADGH